MIKENSISLWLKGIPYEVAFWNNVCRWNHTFKGMMGWSKYGKIINLEGFDVNTWLCSRESPKVLDVGCGMSYATGNFIGNNEKMVPLDIHYVDPLAYYYNTIIRRHRRQIPNIEFGMAEYLSAFYPSKSIDLVIIQNALDHSANPIKCIIECVEVLKIEALLYLNHHMNEAETEKYKGFHQYNICDKGGRLYIWNKQQQRDVAVEIEKFACVEKVIRLGNNHIVTIIRKTNDVPSELLTDKTDKRELCTFLIKQFNHDNKLLNVIKYKIIYWKYNAIQFFAQSLPWTLKMKLKRIIKQA